MNLNRRTLSAASIADAPNLAEFQSNSDVGGEKSIFNRAGIGVITSDKLIERVGNFEETRRKLLP